MPDFHQAEINALLDKRDKALAEGDTMVAQAAVNQAHLLDRATLEIESARREFGAVKGTPQEIFKQRCQIAAHVGGVATAAPDHLEGWRLLAAMLATVGNFQGVLHATADGLKRSPRDLDLWLRRTRAFLRLRQMSQAAKALRYCVDLAPDHGWVKELVNQHPLCAHCLSLLPSAQAATCLVCNKPGPAAGGVTVSISLRNQSKFDALFPQVRDVVAKAMGIKPERAGERITLNTMLKRDFMANTMDCANVLNAMTVTFGERFDAPLFKAALIGYLDILIADLIRATKL